MSIEALIAAETLSYYFIEAVKINVLLIAALNTILKNKKTLFTTTLNDFKLFK